MARTEYYPQLSPWVVLSVNKSHAKAEPCSGSAIKLNLAS